MLSQFRSFTPTTKILIVASLTLLLNGYLCRIAGIYFFWESKTLGWMLVFITALSILIERIRDKKLQGKKVLSEKIFICLILFVLAIESLLLFALPRTDAYAAAKHFLLTDGKIKNQVGEVEGFFLIPLGGIAMYSDSQGESGNADLNVTVKGGKNYFDVHLIVTKSPNTDWVSKVIE